MISRDEFTVRLVDDLPASVGGFVTESPDGHLNIYINARHGWNGQRRSLRHELRHADADDLRSSEPLAVIEARADQKPSPSPLPSLLPSPMGKVARPVAGSDEVAARLASIPHLILARDLVPHAPPTIPPTFPPAPPTLTPPTPRQLAIVRRAIAELDKIYLRQN